MGPAASPSPVLFEGLELGMLDGSPFVGLTLHLGASRETTLCPLLCRSSEEGRRCGGGDGGEVKSHEGLAEIYLVV